MVVGFNHNVRYREQLFHIQTEDSGLKSPNIITLLYVGGTILASKKTSYSDIAKVDNLETVVEELMKEQHKEMLRRLKNGDFDPMVEALLAGKPLPAPPRDMTPPPPQSAPPAKASPAPPPPAKAPAGKAPSEETVVETSLDDIILSYLVGEDSGKK